MSEDQQVSDSLELQKIVGQIAAAYFSNNHVAPAEIPTVMNQIAASLTSAGAPAVENTVEVAEEPKLTPAQIRRTITPDALISLEDNKRYKTLRRHLATRGLTPDEYRAKWGLPKDYPMVAPSYSEARSQLAKAAGLGARIGGKAAAGAAPAAPEPVAPVTSAPAAPEPAPAAVAAEAAAKPARISRRKAGGAAKRPARARKSNAPAKPRA